MHNEAFPTRKMRAALRAKLPPRAFLKIDRAEALFITNAPMFSADIPEAAGFYAYRRGRNLCYTPDESWLIRLERRNELPPDELCATLFRFRGEKIGKDALKLYVHALKLAENADTLSAAEAEAFEGKIRRHTALALRLGGGGGLYGLAVLNAQLKKHINRQKEDTN